MTKTEFKSAMLRGLGRCVTAVQQDPEKYRSVVLWACGRDISYDTQSEGTRAWYVYKMACSYPDRESFVHAASDALTRYRPNNTWDLAHLGELLMYFACDGYETARAAVEEAYQKLLAGMRKRTCRPKGVAFSELTDLQLLGVLLADNRAAFLRIAGDFGRLCREKTYMMDGDFDSFFAEKSRQYKKAMERAAKTDQNIACFLQRELAYLAEMEAQHEERKRLPISQKTGIPLSKWLATEADFETVQQYARKYRETTQPELRAEALSAFVACPYPDDPQPILEDALSACETLRSTAWRVLENIQHSAVRSFALNNAAAGIQTTENFALLAKNYMSEDGPLLKRLLQTMIDSKDWDSVHAAGMDVCCACRQGSSIPRPKHLLPLLYEHTPCSCCRKTIVTCMSRHRMLTEDLLEECLNDSDDHIRSFAKKRLSQKRDVIAKATVVKRTF